MSEETVRKTQIYTRLDTSKHKGKRSTYLVENLRGSNIVARIMPLQMVNELVADEEISIMALKQQLSLASDPVTKGKHTIQRVVKGNVK